MRGHKMGGDLQWLIGIGVSLYTATIAVVIASFRAILGKIGRVHERIDQVKDDYVRREDLDTRLSPITESVRDLKDEVKDGLARVTAAQDRLFDHLTKGN